MEALVFEDSPLADYLEGQSVLMHHPRAKQVMFEPHR